MKKSTLLIGIVAVGIILISSWFVFGESFFPKSSRPLSEKNNVSDLPVFTNNTNSDLAATTPLNCGTVDFNQAQILLGFADNTQFKLTDKDLQSVKCMDNAVSSCTAATLTLTANEQGQSFEALQTINGKINNTCNVAFMGTADGKKRGVNCTIAMDDLATASGLMKQQKYYNWLNPVSVLLADELLEKTSNPQEPGNFKLQCKSTINEEWPRKPQYKFPLTDYDASLYAASLVPTSFTNGGYGPVETYDKATDVWYEILKKDNESPRYLKFKSDGTVLYNGLKITEDWLQKPKYSLPIATEHDASSYAISIVPPSASFTTGHVNSIVSYDKATDTWSVTLEKENESPRFIKFKSGSAILYSGLEK